MLKSLPKEFFFLLYQFYKPQYLAENEDYGNNIYRADFTSQKKYMPIQAIIQDFRQQLLFLNTIFHPSKQSQKNSIITRYRMILQITKYQSVSSVLGQTPISPSHCLQRSGFSQPDFTRVCCTQQTQQEGSHHVLTHEHLCRQNLTHVQYLAHCFNHGEIQSSWVSRGVTLVVEQQKSQYFPGCCRGITGELPTHIYDLRLPTSCQ